MEWKIHRVSEWERENSFNCFFLAHTKLSLRSSYFCATILQRKNPEKQKTFLNIYFIFFLVVDVIELWQEFSPFISFLSSREHFQGKIAPLHNYGAREWWLCIVNAVIANKFFNAMALFLCCRGRQNIFKIFFKIFFIQPLLLHHLLRCSLFLLATS